jgi:hypothetical protein
MSTLIEQDADQVATVVEEEVIQLVGLMARYKTVDEIMDAADRVLKAGFTRFDVHSPFPIHGIDHVMGIRPTRLPWLVLCGGLFGLFGGMWLQWYCNAYDYPLLVSGKPLWSLPANIPVIFESAVLCASITAVFGMLGLNRLPMLYNPLFKSDAFRRVTNDRFFLTIDATDPKFDEQRTADLLQQSRAATVERVED